MAERDEMPIANALRSLRQAAGLSQADLARLADTTRQTISALEAGSYAPTLAIALRLARALGCRVDDLFWLEQPWPAGVIGRWQRSQDVAVGQHDLDRQHQILGLAILGRYHARAGLAPVGL